MASNTGTLWWFVQRATSVLMLVAVVYSAVWWLGLDGVLTYSTYAEFLLRPATRIIGLLAGLSMVLHALYGIWGVLGDYMNQHTGGAVLSRMRPLVLFVCVIVALAYLLWIIRLLWLF